jgi:hypothetical protein
MSKIYWPFLLTFSAAALVLLSLKDCASQELNVNIRIQLNPPVANVVGHFGDRWSPAQLSFLSGYAGIGFPNERVTNIGRSGDSWSYTVDLSSQETFLGVAHVSWVDNQRGVLRLSDLLPQPTSWKSALVTLELPPEWHSFDSHIKARNNFVRPYRNVDKGVIVIGTEWRYTDVRLSPGFFRLLYSVEWQFGRPEAEAFLTEIFDHYAREFSLTPGREFQVALLSLPKFDPNGGWAAETRASNIFIISSEPVFKSQSLQRFHEQLRHEMFHLWIPEGVNLNGHYDWFYEGFALYQSLKLGVAVNRLRFEDYLDTLSRAYDIDRRLGGKTSLIGVSKNRWSGDNNTVIYARGMLVAFLCDLAVLNTSKSKRSTNDIVREVYRRHSGDVAEKDGNEAVVSILKERPELASIVDDYVHGAKQFDWTRLLATAGLQSETTSGVTALKAVPKLSGSQKRLLDKLGYNNWRKLSSKQ